MADETTAIVNQSLQMMGDNAPQVTGVAPTFDTSTAGKAAAQLYAPCVAFVARQFEWDFARKNITLTLTANTPPLGWTYEYQYPTNGIEVWQLLPATLTDPYNPLPSNWAVGNAVVSATLMRVIWTNVVNARAIYNNNPAPGAWDAGFREAVVRLLASEFAIALGGRPETSAVLLQSATGASSMAQSRDG